MKYISLLAVANWYAHHTKDRRSLSRICAPSGYQGRMLTIRQTTAETGQIMKNISTVVPQFLYHNFHTGYLTDAEMFPIMEIEYMKKTLPFGDPVFEVLEHMAYFYIVMAMFPGSQLRMDSWADEVNDSGCIKELEDIEDALLVMEKQKFFESAAPKIAEYETYIFSDTDFLSLFYRCEKQTTKLMEFYYHIPVLLSIFLVDNERLNFNTWTKTQRIRLVEEINYLHDMFSEYRLINMNHYSYGTSANPTDADRDFVFTIFDYIVGKIKNKNAKMGIISYDDYTDVRGPEHIEATVRLSNMHINWDEEIERAEQEKASSGLAE